MPTTTHYNDATNLANWERELLGLPVIARRDSAEQIEPIVVDSRVRPTGNMRTVTLSPEQGYVLSIRMPSRASILRAMDNGQRVVRTVPIDLRVSFNSSHPEYTTHIPSGAITESWEFSSNNYGSYIDAAPVRPADDVNMARRQKFIRHTLLAILRNDTPPPLWSYLLTQLGIDASSPSHLLAANLHVRNATYRERFSQEFDTALSEGETSSWADNFAVFQQQWSEAKAKISQGTIHPALIAQTGSLNGLSTGMDARGRSFGIEIEVDFPDDYRCQAKHTLAARLYAEGLTRDDVVHGWHYAARANSGGRGSNAGEGYTDARNGWTVEFDRSVDDCDGARGCEVVSPILYDVEQSWKDLAKVCEIITELGGKITNRHGLHVNIGARDFSLDVGAHYRLVRLMRQFDDVLIRMAHNPEIGNWHRGRTYCEMDSYLTLNEGSDLYTIKQYHSHMSNVNFDHMPHEGQRAGSSTRVEFRIFDGSIDAGRIQANTRLAMGMVHAAVRGVSLDLNDEPSGTHRGNRRARRLTGPEWKADTERFRILVDALFPRESDKIAALHCYAASRWQQR